jgi:cell filamentation protein
MSKADAKRKNIVKQAIANERLEGFQVSEESKRIADSYIVGKVTAKEAAKKIRARYGVL